MDCYLCGLGASVPHGRMLCAWRVLGNAAKVRLAFELEGIMKTTEPNEVERLRLAWWVVRHERLIDCESRALTSLSNRAIAKASAARMEASDAFDRAIVDIDRYAANRYALGALEALESAP
jgi:hypothetical protein